MKRIVYKREIPALIEKKLGGEQVVIREAYLQTESLAFTDSNEDIQIAEALKYAYNGEYTIEDDGQPEPEPSREEKLEAEVAELKEALKLLLTGVTE